MIVAKTGMVVIPESCKECWEGAVVISTDDGSEAFQCFMCGKISWDWETETRPDYCPLIEVEA